MLRVFKLFPSGLALRNVSLSIHRAERVHIEGGPGSGKSTLLRLLGLRERPSQGQMVVDGAEVNTLPCARTFARRRRLIYICPADALFDRLNLKQNLQAAADMAGPPEPKTPRHCMEMLAFVGLSSLWQHKPPALSAPQRLSLLLARALIRMPRMLLVDGCMDGMSPAALGHWAWALGQCQAQGTTVVAAGAVAGCQAFPQATRRLRLEGGLLHTLAGP